MPRSTLRSGATAPELLFERRPARVVIEKKEKNYSDLRDEVFSTTR